MSFSALALVETVDAEWVGASLKRLVHKEPDNPRVYFTVDSLDDHILYEWLPSMGWKVAGVSPDGDDLEVMVVPEN